MTLLGNSLDEFYMQHALHQAELARQHGEVPVGAVVVFNNEIIAQGYNQPINQHDPSAHAEIQVLRIAGQQQNNYRLLDCTLYVTLEPCVMCAGAIMHARIPRLVYAAADPKTGACGSVINVFSETKLNHHTEVQGGVLASQSSQLLKSFFSERRIK